MGRYWLRGCNPAGCFRRHAMVAGQVRPVRARRCAAGAPVSGSRYRRRRYSRNTTGVSHNVIVASPSMPATGRVKNSLKSPPLLMRLDMRFFSTMGPRTIPSTTGPTGNPYRSRAKPRIPMRSMRLTSKRLLLMAYEPTTQNTTMVGKRKRRGTRTRKRPVLMAR